MNQVLDELGVGIGQEMASVPATRAPEAASTVSVDADLQVHAYHHIQPLHVSPASLPIIYYDHAGALGCTAPLGG